MENNCIECNSEETLLCRDDFDCVGQLAKHCDNEKLCIAIQESQDFEGADLLGDFFYDILDNKDDEEYKELICGGTYVGCNGRKVRFKGVKRMLVYYAYSRYLLLNEFNDTPNGSVSKENEWSIPKDWKSIKDFSNKYKDMGHSVFKDIEDYLCHNKNKFTGFNACNCSCECNDGCDTGRSKSKFNFNIIKK